MGALVSLCVALPAGLGFRAGARRSANIHSDRIFFIAAAGKVAILHPQGQAFWGSWITRRRYTPIEIEDSPLLLLIISTVFEPSGFC
jgi:hypothetical protein